MQKRKLVVSLLSVLLFTASFAPISEKEYCYVAVLPRIHKTMVKKLANKNGPVRIEGMVPVPSAQTFYNYYVDISSVANNTDTTIIVKCIRYQEQTKDNPMLFFTAELRGDTIYLERTRSNPYLCRAEYQDIPKTYLHQALVTFIGQ